MIDQIRKYKIKITEYENKIKSLIDHINSINQQLESVKNKQILLEEHPFLEELSHNDADTIKLRSKLLMHNRHINRIIFKHSLLYSHYTYHQLNDSQREALLHFIIYDNSKFNKIDLLVITKINKYLEQYNYKIDMFSEDYKINLFSKIDHAYLYIDRYHKLNDDIELEAIIRTGVKLLDFKPTIGDYNIMIKNVTPLIFEILYLLFIGFLYTVIYYNISHYIIFLNPDIWFITLIFVLYITWQLYRGDTENVKKRRLSDLHKGIWGLTTEELMEKINIFNNDIEDYKQNLTKPNSKLNSKESELIIEKKIVFDEINVLNEAIQKISKNIIEAKGKIDRDRKRKEKQERVRKQKIQEEIERKQAIELEMLQKECSYWLDLNGHEFEEKVSILFERIGLRSYTTLGSNDGGIDIVVHWNNEMVPVQCKNHAKAISPNAIRDFQGAISTIEDVNKSIFISSNGYTPKAKKQAILSNILLFDIEDIVMLHKKDQIKINQLMDYLKKGYSSGNSKQTKILF